MACPSNPQVVLTLVDEDIAYLEKRIALANQRRTRPYSPEQIANAEKQLALLKESREKYVKAVLLRVEPVSILIPHSGG